MKKLGLDYDQINKKSLDPEIISYCDSEMENLWNGLVGHWVSMDFKQSSDKVYSKSPFFGLDCVTIAKEISADSDEMIEFLITVSIWFFNFYVCFL